MSRHRVVIVGGGFGGLETARGLGRAAVDVTLLDRRNFHLFQPLLYQVATGELSPGEIAAPLRAILKRQLNTRVLLAAVHDIDPQAHRVLCGDCDVPCPAASSLMFIRSQIVTRGFSPARPQH